MIWKLEKEKVQWANTISIGVSCNIFLKMEAKPRETVLAALFLTNPLEQLRAYVLTEAKNYTPICK